MKSKTILFQGDSITDGNRGRNEDPNHILGHGYAYIAASELGYRCAKKNYKFINRGISGNTSADLYTRWQKDCLSLKPDIVSILIGINDTAQENTTPRELLCYSFEETMRLLLSQTKNMLPSTNIILMEPFILDADNQEKDEFQRNFDNLHEKQQILINLSKEYKTLFIPLQDRFNKASKIRPAKYWIWDSIHPTYAGHGLIAKAWLNDTKDLFE